MNPIENLFHILKLEIRKRKPKNMKELKKCVEKEWNKIELMCVKSW